MGNMEVPADALYGASTERARQNFPISGEGVNPQLVHAFGLLKATCAEVNMDLGQLDDALGKAIVEAATEVADGKLDPHFVVDVFQTGSGTSTNMNANEVIANRISQMQGKAIGSKDPVHPNDHVNMGQSSNDTFPTAMHIAAATQIHGRLIPALKRVHEILDKKAKEWDDALKIGRTHLMDATPIRMGQVFAGYASQVEHGVKRMEQALEGLCELAIGGTAVGTGINTHVKFGGMVAEKLAKKTGVPFREADNHCECQAAKDACVQASGAMKTVAVSLSKIANDIRWLGSGPRCGLGELVLPAIQPGSSIMPGKVNPVICESVVQVAAKVIGNDVSVTYGGFGGVGSILELNVGMPMMAQSLMESIHLLTEVSNVFVDKLLVDLEVNRERCEELIEQSLMMCTSLAPAIGYDNAAKLAKTAFAEGKTVRQVALEMELLDADKLNELLDARSMTEPGDGK